MDGETQTIHPGMYVFFMDILDDESGAYVQGVYASPPQVILVSGLSAPNKSTILV